MNQNWIVENLNNAFSTWNGKLTELWGLVTTSPQTFKGGAVWGVMQSLHNAMIGIGYALIVLFFAISLFKNTANFHELKRPEAAVHYLMPVWAVSRRQWSHCPVKCSPPLKISVS